MLILFAVMALPAGQPSSPEGMIYHQQIRKQYADLLLLEDQFQNCTGPHGVAAQLSRLKVHRQNLARLRASARRAGARQEIAAIDRHAKSLIDAVDTSCIVGPDKKTEVAIGEYDRDLRKAERQFAAIVAKLRLSTGR